MGARMSGRFMTPSAPSRNGMPLESMFLTALLTMAACRSTTNSKPSADTSFTAISRFDAIYERAALVARSF
eukprot:CAMPEP_0119160232 /NCGR_PEP_ID=MMETSP1315-20130426/187_1 /TAXON_ID=676789 /ORGANISM="Prasinoderma singularis, Strain RCC927" /LENGTH=70 /DNA_ID=CAMNT_0007152879 /DNA_START=338 /DNA_END=550 /DNA_ORIENTATION=-